MATTAAAIRDAMLTLVEALTPTLAAETKFERHREAINFRDWCERNPSAAFRRFSIRYQGDSTPTPVGNTQIEETSHTFEVTIAYPNSARLGHPKLLELDDVIDADQTKVHATIGPPGYASLTAPATVLHQENWSREVGETVVFAVIRYRVDFYRATGATSTACSVYDNSTGVPYKTGDVISGETDLRNLRLSNGLARVSYELPNGAEPGACHLFIEHDGSWLRCFRPGYGDWSFFVVPIAVTADRAVVLEASDDVVEISLEWTAFDLDTGYLATAGAYERNHNLLVGYNSGSVIPRLIDTIYLRKLIRLERGRRGYFAGWHSSPHIGPDLSLLTAVGAVRNNYDGWYERELGTGGGSRVAWSSAGQTGYFPAWRSQRDWSAVTTAYPSFNNFAWWPGIDDATYTPWAYAEVIAMMPAGFPNEQAAGPYYVADIPDASFGGDANVCRYIVQRNPNEIGVWNYAGQYGELVNHFTNPWREADGRPTKFPVFIGAEPYTSDTTAVAVTGYTGNVDYGNEPKTGIRTTIATLAAEITNEWPT